MDLKDEIKKIVELQEIDRKLYRLNNEKNIEKPAYLENLKSEFEQKKQSLSGCEESLKKVQLKKKEREIELAAKEENLRKAQTQLYQLKTNKEYQVKLKEIGSLKADISLEEENILKGMEEIEVTKESLDHEKSQISQAEEKFKTEEVTVKEAIKDIEAEIKTLQDKRSRFLESIDKQILSRYEQLLKKRQGLAIAEVHGSNCGSCFMQLTHQKVNEIKMYKNLVFCENCVRILYLGEDLTR